MLLTDMIEAADSFLLRFGLDYNRETALKKVIEEFCEVLDDPDDPKEVVDLIWAAVQLLKSHPEYEKALADVITKNNAKNLSNCVVVNGMVKKL